MYSLTFRYKQRWRTHTLWRRASPSILCARYSATHTHTYTHTHTHTHTAHTVHIDTHIHIDTHTHAYTCHITTQVEDRNTHAFSALKQSQKATDLTLSSLTHELEADHELLRCCRFVAIIRACVCVCVQTDRRTDRQTHTQTHRRVYRRTDGQTDTQTHRQTD